MPIGSYRAVRGSLSAAKNEPPIGIKIKNSAAPAATRLIKGLVIWKIGPLPRHL